MAIRVIGGSAKGRNLKMVPGNTTRPVMDRVKESLFNILGRRVVGAAFLDLFAGTGSVGIEALSRGARQCVFVETDRRAVQTIRENLALTKLGERAVIRRVDVFELLQRAPLQSFEFIYVAPPQYKDLWMRALNLIDANPAWAPSQTTVILQIDPSEERAVALQHLTEIDRRRYGNTLLWFFMGKALAETKE